MKVFGLVIAIMAAMVIAAPIEPAAGMSSATYSPGVILTKLDLVDRGVSGTSRGRGGGGFKRDEEFIARDDTLEERGVGGQGSGRGGGGFKRDNDVVVRGVGGQGRGRGAGGF